MKIFALVPVFFLVSALELVVAGPAAQTVLSNEDRIATIETLLAIHDDPVHVTRLLYSGDASGSGLDEPRLLQIMGTDEKQWLTEGDKLRLRKNGVGFIDLTDFQDMDGSALALMSNSDYTTDSESDLLVLRVKFRD